MQIYYKNLIMMMRIYLVHKKFKEKCEGKKKKLNKLIFIY